MEERLIKFLRSLDIYRDYYGGPVIDDVIENLDEFFKEELRLNKIPVTLKE